MQPSLTHNRIITVDALRGIALLGILLAHMCFWYNAGQLPGELFQKYNDIGNQIISTLNDVLISGKFFAFFSFLFGLSFYLQMERMEQKSVHFVWRYAWRIALMGIIGLVHHLFWSGDILSIYAPLGFILILTRKWSNKWVLIVGILFAINVPHKLIDIYEMLKPVVPAVKGAPQNNYEAESKAFLAIVQGNSWVNLWSNNFKQLANKFDFQFGSGRIYITFGFFLLGMYAGRLNWFNNIASSKAFFKKLLKRCTWIAFILLLIAIGIIVSNEVFKLGWQESRTVGFFFGILYDTFNATLVMVYVTGFSLLLNKASWLRISGWFASIGKMALTCYLSQTLIGLFLFYGVGLGLVGKTAPWMNWLMAIGFFVLQVLLSSWWLKRFYYGPVEWLWRSATYFRFYPMRKK